MLSLKDIKKDYYVVGQTISALKGVTLDFRRNEFVSILGASGCGKTTLMNIIGGLDKYTGGDIVINGKSTENYSASDWDDYRNKKIGFIFQSYNLITHLSILENVELALTLSGIGAAERRERATDALKRVGLENYLLSRPNQLSGGQMQRVAIARALVNSPEILLADEPTGALDTKTSTQIMELIKEISGDKLVIMVTHNPELAAQYSTRTISIVDGLITGDSNPYDSSKDVVYRNEVEQLRAADELTEKSKVCKKSKKKQLRKSSMSFWTALLLSFKNLLSKKGRTILTSIAGSIGIIGIALILAISNGTNAYIAKLSADTLSTNPITISMSGVDISQAMQAMGSSDQFEKFPDSDKIFVDASFDISKIMHKNNITDDYVSYIEQNIAPEWCSDIMYKNGQNINFYAKRPGETTYSKAANSVSYYGNVFQQLPIGEFTRTQYDVLAGSYPEGKNELALVIDDSNHIPDSVLIALGLKNDGDETVAYTFDEILQKDYKIPLNDDAYLRVGNVFAVNSDIDFDSALTVKIVGIMRINQQTEMGVLYEGIAYTPDLYEYLTAENGESQIVGYMRENVGKNPMTGDVYSNIDATNQEKYEKDLRGYGGIKTPNEISIYPKNLDGKENIKRTLDAYNEGKDDEDIVKYTDMSVMMANMMSSMVDLITYVLIGFTSISLVVSSVMIGIITYVSVIERTKEIGILRSIGARKKDITRVFNAETFIVGLLAGLIGVLIAALLTIPINLIAAALIGIEGIAGVSFIHALILIVISVCLTLISGLIPAMKASRKDPVTALRSE